MVGKKTDDRIQHDFSLPQLECHYVYSIIVETLGQQFPYFLRNRNVCYERKMCTKIDRCGLSMDRFRIQFCETIMVVVVVVVVVVVCPVSAVDLIQMVLLDNNWARTTRIWLLSS